MKVTINEDGTIATHGDSLTGDGVISFPTNERPGFPAGWTVTGSAPNRVLRDPHNNKVVAEDTAGALEEPISLPAGGTTGQVPTKASNADGDVDWEDPQSGTSVGAWTKVFDIADEPDLSNFTATGDGTFSLAGDVISQTSNAVTDGTLQLTSLTAWLEAAGLAGALAVAYKFSLTVPDAVPATGFVSISYLGAGVLALDDGSIINNGPGSGSAVLELDHPYAVVATANGMQGSNDIAGVLTPAVSWFQQVTQSFTSGNEKIAFRCANGALASISGLQIYAMGYTLP